MEVEVPFSFQETADLKVKDGERIIGIDAHAGEEDNLSGLAYKVQACLDLRTYPNVMLNPTPRIEVLRCGWMVKPVADSPECTHGLLYGKLWVVYCDLKEQKMKLINDVGTFHDINRRVLQECIKRNISGAFAVADLHRYVIRFGYIRMEKPVREGVEGKDDCNLLAVCLSKIAMVMVHRKNTGDRTKFVGEVPSKGGHLSKDGQFAYAFSGGSQEENDELVQIAEEAHAALGD